MTKKTTMVSQWREVKRENKGAILFFQVGKFYEVIGFDAYLAKKILSYKITPRGCGNGTYLPMVGIPVDSSEMAINKFNDEGFKVILTKQLDEEIDGLKKREVTEVHPPKEYSSKVRKYEKLYNEFLVSDFIGFIKNKERTKEEERVKKKEGRLESTIINKIKELKLEHMSSYDALKLLHEWRKEIRKI